MSEPVDEATPSRPAWQPFTFGGLAAFAQAGLGRLLLAELVIAMLVSGSVVLFLHHAYLPVIEEAIQKMPESAKIARGQITGVDSTVIAEGKLLAIAVTPDNAEQIGQSADLQLQFRPSDFRVGAVFRPDWGWEFEYGPDTTLNLSRSTLEPWWGAWHPVFLAAVGVSIIVVLFVIWGSLALVYTIPAVSVAWFADRQLTWTGSWLMSSAALLPGALLMGAAVLFYGWQAIDLVGLAFFLAAHLLIGWVYLVGAALACPRLYSVTGKQNPFNT